MSKKFNIREWVLSVKYWSLLFIPHVSICLIFFIYTLVGASIIQEIESDDTRLPTSSVIATESTIVTIKNFDREREKLLSKIIDKRQTVDLQQYTKYITKHIREYEDELKKTHKSVTSSSSVQIPNNDQQIRWTYAGSMFFIGTTLTTIGTNEFSPVTKIGKLFLMFYAAIGIPLTLVFLTDLSLLITRLIKYLSLVVLRVYSTKYFLHFRQWWICRQIEKFLNISIPTVIEEEDIFSSKTLNPLNSTDQTIERPKTRRTSLSTEHFQRLRLVFNVLVETLQNVDDNVDLTMPQLISTLMIYILIGAYLISGNSYFDNIYICFTSLFSIQLKNFYRHVNSQEHNIRSLFLVAIYFLFGLAIVSLCIKAVQIRIRLALEHLGEKVLRDLVEFLRQMGFHELSTDEILATNELTLHPTSTTIETNGTRAPRLSRAASTNFSLEQSFSSFSSSTNRPIGVAEPLRRSSGSILHRTTKNVVVVEREKSTDKSVQVNTIIRSCGRCAGSTLSGSSLKLHNAISSATSSTGDLTSTGSPDDGDMSPSLAPPNLDRLRQRRATLVAKTIINQMATQPSLTVNDERIVAPVVHIATQRARSSAEPTTKAFKFEITPAESSSTSTNTNEFSEISKQISSLLVPSDEES